MNAAIEPLLGSGLEIDGAHERGLSLMQLRAAVQAARTICGSEVWLDTITGCRVEIDSINLYHLVDNLIKPSTAGRRCSWVELIATSAENQLPVYFVSHWWGKRLKDFVACLILFLERHDIDDMTCFWICGYALRQHNLEIEIQTGDPAREPFALALQSPRVKGTVMVLDEDMHTWQRAWVCFEAVTTIRLNRRLDVCTTETMADGDVEARMLADGPAGSETDAEREARDQSFPVYSAEKGMEVTIQLCRATKRHDLNRILNAIASGMPSAQESFSQAPFLEDQNYDAYNNVLRCKFASIVMRLAIMKGDADLVRKTLVVVPKYDIRTADAQGTTPLALAKQQLLCDPQPARKDIVKYLDRHQTQLTAFDIEDSPRQDIGDSPRLGQHITLSISAEALMGGVVVFLLLLLAIVALSLSRIGMGSITTITTTMAITRISTISITTSITITTTTATYLFAPASGSELRATINGYCNHDAVMRDHFLKTHGHIDTWDTSSITDMKGIFYGTSDCNHNLSHWNVERVTIMSSMFRNSKFNGYVNAWNVSRVQDMSHMFHEAQYFNEDLTTWDVSRVTDMNNMFSKAVRLNRDLGAWNVHNVANMNRMFFAAESFNGSLSGWNTARVTSMAFLFRGASRFSGRLIAWDVSNVLNMRCMFTLAESFSGDLRSWNVGKVMDMEWMFRDATLFVNDVSPWNVSQVRNMQYMFWGAYNFNSDLNGWSVSKVSNMARMFFNASSFNGDVNSWNVSRVRDMQWMFRDAKSFNKNLSAWNVSRVTNMQYMFSGASNFSADLSTWNVNKVTDMRHMFNDAKAFKSDLSRWNTSEFTKTEFMFEGATSFKGCLSKREVSRETKNRTVHVA